MIYNFTVKLKGLTFKYKSEADNVTDAMVNVRNHIRNAVELVEDKPVKKSEKDIFNNLKDIMGI
jgi:hypothetical protein